MVVRVAIRGRCAWRLRRPERHDGIRRGVLSSPRSRPPPALRFYANRTKSTRGDELSCAGFGTMIHDLLKRTANFGQELRADPEKHEAIPAQTPLAAPSHAALAALVQLVLDAVPSPKTKALYGQAVREFLSWYQAEQPGAMSKAVVQRYRTTLEDRGLAGSSVNVRLAALRKLADEAADNGLLAPETAAAIARVKGASGWA